MRHPTHPTAPTILTMLTAAGAATAAARVPTRRLRVAPYTPHTPIHVDPFTGRSLFCLDADTLVTVHRDQTRRACRRSLDIHSAEFLQAVQRWTSARCPSSSELLKHPPTFSVYTAPNRRTSHCLDFTVAGNGTRAVLDQAWVDAGVTAQLRIREYGLELVLGFVVAALCLFFCCVCCKRKSYR